MDFYDIFSCGSGKKRKRAPKTNYLSMDSVRLIDKTDNR